MNLYLVIGDEDTDGMDFWVVAPSYRHAITEAVARLRQDWSDLEETSIKSCECIARGGHVLVHQPQCQISSPEELENAHRSNSTTSREV